VQHAARSVIGAALDLGAGRAASTWALGDPLRGPRARLASSGSTRRPRERRDGGAEAIDAGDEQARFLPQIKATCERIADARRRGCRRRLVPVVLGGDHSVALGTLGGSRGARAGRRIWIDAHGDLNSPRRARAATSTGWCSPRRSACGERFRGDGWGCRRSTGRVALVGVRSLDEASASCCGARRVRVHDERRRPLGVERAMREALDACRGPGFVHVSLDMDASIPTSRRASARPCAAGSPIARRTSRWS
jgi:arginase